jgi:PPP family 3-phenylpropionic acid transporter
VEGTPGPSYPLVRVWGTVGFILPSLLLFIPLSRGASASAILPCAVFFCLLSLANSFSLPKIDRPIVTSGRLPTREALRAIFSPQARWLSIGLFFGFLAASCYYAFIGNYLDEVVGIPKRHIGLIINLGVALEIGFTLAMPWLQQKIHLKGILVAGLACMAGRMVLLTMFPHPIVAVVVQIFHGLEVLALYIGPVMFLDRLAKNEYRNSIQGVFTMVIGGVARVVGGLLAGFVVMKSGLEGGLIYGALMATISFLILTFLFSRIPPREEIEVSPEGAS